MELVALTATGLVPNPSENYEGEIPEVRALNQDVVNEKNKGCHCPSHEIARGIDSASSTGGAAAYLRSLQIRAVEEKNIPRPQGK